LFNFQIAILMQETLAYFRCESTGLAFNNKLNAGEKRRLGVGVGRGERQKEEGRGGVVRARACMCVFL
jgi:hypothetical protein